MSRIEKAVWRWLLIWVFILLVWVATEVFVNLGELFWRVVLGGG